MTFSFRAGLLFRVVIGARCVVSFVAGADVLVVALGSGVDLGEDWDLPGAFVSVANSRTLLPEHRPVSRKENRSFLEGNSGVSRAGRDLDAWPSGVDSRCCPFKRDLDSG